MNNPVKAEVERQMESQMSKGELKYGHGIILDDGHDWLQEAIEECVDQLQYLCAAKLERDGKRNMVQLAFDEQLGTKSGYLDTNEGLVYIGGITDTQVPTRFELHGVD